MPEMSIKMMVVKFFYKKTGFLSSLICEKNEYKYLIFLDLINKKIFDLLKYFCLPQPRLNKESGI